MFAITPIGGTPTNIKVASDRIIRRNGRQNRAKLNYKGKTLVVFASEHASWAGELLFDNATERDFLRTMHAARTFLLTEDLTGGSQTPVQVLWEGDFLPRYLSISADSGSVPFIFEQV